MSKAKKKLYGTGLGVAALIAMIDVLNGPPAESDAVAPLDSAALVIQPDERPSPPDAAAEDEGPLFPFSGREVDWEAVRDPFLEPQAVRVAGRGPEQVETPAVDPDGPPTVARFIEEHVLMGIMVTRTGGVAIVNDIAVDSGQTIDRALLLRVGSNAAYFQCADGIATLHVLED